jgi:hypothetical protein
LRDLEREEQLAGELAVNAVLDQCCGDFLHGDVNGVGVFEQGKLESALRILEA